MLKTKWTIALAVVLCAILLPTTLVAKKQVERPHKVWGNMTLVLDLATMTWEAEDWGEATHIGRYANEGSGSAGDIYLQNGVGDGIATAASGDELSWHIVAEEGVWTITFNGGTGRFEDATGSCILVPGEVVVTPGPGEITYTYTYTGSGTISY